MKLQIPTGYSESEAVEKPVESVHNCLYIPGKNGGYYRSSVENRGENPTFPQKLQKIMAFAGRNPSFCFVPLQRFLRPFPGGQGGDLVGGALLGDAVYVFCIQPALKSAVDGNPVPDLGIPEPLCSAAPENAGQIILLCAVACCRAGRVKHS